MKENDKDDKDEYAGLSALIAMPIVTPFVVLGIAFINHKYSEQWWSFAAMIGALSAGIFLWMFISILIYGWLSKK
jgi:hypothetical protein